MDQQRDGKLVPDRKKKTKPEELADMNEAVVGVIYLLLYFINLVFHKLISSVISDGR